MLNFPISNFPAFSSYHVSSHLIFFSLLRKQFAILLTRSNLAEQLPTVIYLHHQLTFWNSKSTIFVGRKKHLTFSYLIQSFVLRKKRSCLVWRMDPKEPDKWITPAEVRKQDAKVILFLKSWKSSLTCSIVSFKHDVGQLFVRVKTEAEDKIVCIKPECIRNL